MEWRAAFEQRFAPNDAGRGFLDLSPGSDVLVVKGAGDEEFRLPTRAPNSPHPALPPGTRYWRPLAELGPTTSEHPLAGLRIALDPGHLGGIWGKMEGRSFSFNGDPPVQEGDLALRVAQLLKPRLESLGAQVSFVRSEAGPVTGERFEDVHPAGRADVDAFLNREIRARAVRVNEVLQPDLVLCLHLDAVAWPDPQKPALVAQPQHFHIMVNGSYEPAEIANAGQRLEMLERIASGAGDEELKVALAMAERAAPIFGQPPSGYSAPVGIALGGNGYVWGRNVLADRLYRCPVVFLEPYVANSVEGYPRIQAGEYAGTRVFNGVARKNIFAEYGDAVVAGLVQYYGQRAGAR